MEEEERIIKNYCELALIKDGYLINFDYKKSNKATRQMIALDKKLKNDLCMAQRVVDKLRYADSVSLRIWMNELSYDINYKTKESINNLLNLLNENKDNVFSLDIKMYLYDKKNNFKLIKIKHFCKT